MHRSEISDFARNRAKARMNETAAPIDPRRTAHVVIDLQNAFVAEGAPAEVPFSRSIVPNVNRISKTLRDAGGLNIFVRFTVDDAEPNYWTSMHRQTKPELLGGLKRLFCRGTVNHELCVGLDVAQGDLIIDKTRFSALTPGTCDLQRILEAWSIDTIIITGALTNCCCEATARDAMQLGYSVLFIQDGCATHDDAMHNNTLSNLYAFGYAEVCTADEALVRLG